MASYSAKITAKISVYANASTTSKKKTTLKKGDKVAVTATKNDAQGNTWGKTKKGWFMIAKKSNGKQFCSLTTTVHDDDGHETTIDVTRNVTQYKELTRALEENLKEEVGGSLRKTMQLFGLPYQFLPSVDCRVDSVSSEIGRKYIENIIFDAPVVTILPGKPSYLPGESKDNRRSITSAFMQASSGNLGVLQTLAKEMNIDDLKFYDFKTAYMEYMRYVNVMCRACAAFLQLEGNDDENGIQYCINGEPANFMGFDWKDYRWDGERYRSTISRVAGATANKIASSKPANAAKDIANSVLDKFAMLGGKIMGVIEGVTNETYTTTKGKKSKKKNVDTGATKTTAIKKNELNLNDNTVGMSEEETTTVENLFRNVHYVQFYCDVASNSSQTLSNETKESSLKSTFNGFSEKVKDIAFMANTGGDGVREMLEGLGEGLMEGIDAIVGGIGGAFSESAGVLVQRLTRTGTNVIKGDNVIMPDIYANSKYSRTYQIIIPLRSIYGSKTSIYMDVLVPLCHILGLVLPKATTANTFSAPMLVKVFMPGKFTCNMGIVSGMSIESNDDARNVDGLCSDIKVTLDITDLYSDLTMTPASDPILFCNNSSLIEYLAINCGLDLIDAQFSTKVSLFMNSVVEGLKDIPDNVFGKLTEELDSIIYSWSGLGD